MNTSPYDVVVIGAGPAGATTARAAARGGLRVLLVDKRAELGAPTQCSGAISASALREAGVPVDDEYICSQVHGFITYDALGTPAVIDYRRYKPDPIGYCVERKRFDRYLARLATQAGADLLLKTTAESLEREGPWMRVCLRRLGRAETVRARVVVGADGVMSQVGKWAGLRTFIKMSELASCLQFVMDRVPTDGLLEIVAGHEWAPGGYTWVFPRGGSLAEVGLGIIRTETTRDARWHLDHFIRDSWMAGRFKEGRILEVTGGGVPLAAPLKKMYADGVILVGDAARHVNPLTGGGLHTALRSGLIAGTFLVESLLAGAPGDDAHLAGYQKRWTTTLGEQLLQLYEIKARIFSEREIATRDRQLFETLANYFAPASPFRKV
ncbi:MAG: NAD(P)/FAD-dependent oxidoreductase [Ardenticatenaceae bacterium]|nr:NAD(P)/FAD-dependent oxidoreductase [Ardenticatenaceae bacterium]